jgi:hypothetical protein
MESTIRKVYPAQNAVADFIQIRIDFNGHFANSQQGISCGPLICRTPAKL